MHTLFVFAPVTTIKVSRNVANYDQMGFMILEIPSARNILAEELNTQCFGVYVLDRTSGPDAQICRMSRSVTLCWHFGQAYFEDRCDKVWIKTELKA